MLPIRAIRDPRRNQRDERTKRALHLLSLLSQGNGVHTKIRSNVWEQFHRQMEKGLESSILQNFQNDERIAPQICGGGGETFLSRMRERFGEEPFRFFLSTYRETLCGNPPDLTCVEGCTITRTGMKHLYFLAVLHQFAKRYYAPPIDVVEIGGGFGNLARLALEYSLARRYVLIDYPVALCIQYYYLTEFFDEADVALWTGTRYLTGNSQSRLCLTVPEAVPGLAKMLNHPAFMVSTVALTEIPLEGQRYYLDNLQVQAMYVFGQTENTTLPQGAHLAEEAVTSNRWLFQRLAELCHPVHHFEGDYFSEFLGIVTQGAVHHG